MSINRNAKNEKLSLTMQLIAGTQKRFPNASQELGFGGTTRTVSATTALLQSYVDLRNATLASQAATRAKIAAESEQGPPLLAVVSDYVAFIKATFGNQPDVLADFGLTPRKATGTQSSVQKAAAAAKRAATRQARHTMGPNQKKEVKGNVAGVVVTPIIAPPPVVPTPVNPAPTTPTTPATSAPAPGPVSPAPSASHA